MTVEVHEHGRVSAPDVRASVSGLLSGAMSSLAKRVVGRVPRADLDVRDTDYIRETLPGLWMLASIQVMPKIDLRERYGADPNVGEIYADIIRRMQDVLDSLSEERRLPVIG